MINYLKKLLFKSKIDFQFQPGCIYFNENLDEGLFSTVRVLAVFEDASVVYLRTYKRKYRKLPDREELKSFTGKILEGSAEIEIGCVPVEIKSCLDDFKKSNCTGFCGLTDEEIECVNETNELI